MKSDWSTRIYAPLFLITFAITMLAYVIRPQISAWPMVAVLAVVGGAHVAHRWVDALEGEGRGSKSKESA